MADKFCKHCQKTFDTEDWDHWRKRSDSGYRCALKMREKSHRWAKNNKDKVNAFRKEERERDLEVHRARCRKSYHKDIEKSRQRGRDKVRKNQENKTNYHIASMLRGRLYHAVKDGHKGGSAVTDLGCTIAEFRNYLESKFRYGMSWENWSRDGWHIDHIIPLDSFDLSDKEQLKKACYYTNLQPLWAKDNLSKANKVN